MNINFEDKFMSNQFNNSKILDKVDSKPLPSIENKPSWNLGIKDYIAFLALLFFMYFIFGIPGPSVDPISKIIILLINL